MASGVRSRAVLQMLVFASLVPGAFAATPPEERIAELERRTAELAAALARLQGELEAARTSSPTSEPTAELREELVETRRIARDAAAVASRAGEWRESRSVTHLAGYAAAGYADSDSGGAFDVANFNPIFHYQYGDRILWESELEVDVEDNGDTNLALEYSAVNVFLNDNLTVLAGKFISPLGFFRQNLHPAWINRLPSAPPGFGHDGAAPLADIGAQLRGAYLFGGQRLGFAAYVGNGPKLEAENGEIHGLETEGFAGDADDEKVVGTRVSWMPAPEIELAFSLGGGDIAVAEDDGADVSGDPTRDYRVYGADGSWTHGGFELRGEYIEQDVDDAAGSIVPEGANWQTWYAQSSWRPARSPWQGVLRYMDFDAAEADESQEQWALGLNFFVTPNALFKLGYEFNDGLGGSVADEDRFLLQFAYGY